MKVHLASRQEVVMGKIISVCGIKGTSEDPIYTKRQFAAYLAAGMGMVGHEVEPPCCKTCKHIFQKNL